MFDLHEMGQEMGIPFEKAQMLQHKDGIMVARVYAGGHSWILKVYEKAEYRREIACYRLLNKMHVQTLHVIGYSDRALLLEDLQCSSTFRLAVQEDMSSPVIAEKLALWYRDLHTKGCSCVREYRDELYDENKYFSAENIYAVRKQTDTAHLPVWTLLEENMETVLRVLRQVKKTLVYNDFYYTNMAVNRNTAEALMFDYNLLGKGYAYADLRNVVSSLSPEAGKAFLAAYGSYDPMEKMLDDVISPVITLYFACRRAQFPNWAHAALEDMKTTYPEKLMQFLTAAEGYLLSAQGQSGVLDGIGGIGSIFACNQGRPSTDII